MLSPGLSKDLAQYAIGERLHALRMRKKLGLVELARHTELSPGLLSKLERGRLFPTLLTVLRIAMVFSVGLEAQLWPRGTKALYGNRGNHRLN